MSDALDELILEQMILAEGEPSADTLARLCEGLVLIPNPWAKGYQKVDLTASTPPSRQQLIGLSLPWSERRTRELREALTHAETAGFSAEPAAIACESLLSDGFTTVSLPRTAAEVCQSEG